MPNITNRKKQAIETKIRITGAALELYRKGSFDSVRVTDICEAADVSVGAFYHYFDSKDSIIGTAYKSIDELVVSNVESRKYTSYIDKTVDLFTEASGYLSEYGYTFTANAYKAMLTNFDPSTFSKDRDSYRMIIDCLEKGSEKGEITYSGTAEELGNCLMAAGRGLLFDWCLHEGEYDLVEQMDRVIRFTLKSLNVV